MLCVNEFLIQLLIHENLDVNVKNYVRSVLVKLNIPTMLVVPQALGLGQVYSCDATFCLCFCDDNYVESASKTTKTVFKFVMWQSKVNCSLMSREKSEYATVR